MGETKAFRGNPPKYKMNCAQTANCRILHDFTNEVGIFNKSTSKVNHKINQTSKSLMRPNTFIIMVLLVSGVTVSMLRLFC